MKFIMRLLLVQALWPLWNIFPVPWWPRWCWGRRGRR